MGESAAAAPITVEANGRIYTLAFGAGAFRRVEAASGLSFGDLLDRLNKQSFVAMAWLLRAALWRDHPEVTDEEIDAILDEYGLEALAGEDPEHPGPLVQAIVRDMKGKRGGAGNPPTPTPVGTTA